MKSIFSSRRNKSPHRNEEAEKSGTPFFSKESRTPFFNMANGGTVQTKLTVGQPGDKYEKEADSMADAVVNRSSSKPAIQNKAISSIQRESLATPQEDEKLGTAEQRMEEDKLVQEKSELQKMDEQEEEEGMVSQMEGEEEEEKFVRAKSNDSAHTAGVGVSQQIKGKAGKGSPLPKNTKIEMESSFGTDFSGVNIHTDLDAVKMNKELGAQAFTHGQDVYFNSGKYDPGSGQGKHLLAHELTHVVQQNSQLQKKRDFVQTYRNKDSFNFNTNPTDSKKKNTGGLQEDSFTTRTDKDTKPWIEKIYIYYNGIVQDSEKAWAPTGYLLAQYHANSVMPIDLYSGPFGISIPGPRFISFPVTGGKHNEGFTDKGDFTITQIEGAGYNDMPFTKSDGGNLDKSKGEGPNKKYAKDLNSSMSYAIFFKGGQAIHSGALDIGSHGCVHVDWGGSADTGDTSKLQMLNYHSVVGLTKVIVDYDPAILPKLCCERLKKQGKTKGLGINPCDKIKAETC